MEPLLPERVETLVLDLLVSSQDGEIPDADGYARIRGLLRIAAETIASGLSRNRTLDLELDSMRAQRDQVRRMYCMEVAPELPEDEREFARSRGWDCFEDTDG